MISSTVQIDVQEALERGYDVEGIKAKKIGLQQGGRIYRYTGSIKNPVGVEVLILQEVKRG
jgi:hypothetical protein